MKWEIKRLKLFEDKIDVTKFMIRFIEEYPNSLQDPGFDYEKF
jgi:hypothetical protein